MKFLLLQLHIKVMVEHEWGVKGAPWEFNLRDLIRWCELMIAQQVYDLINVFEI